MKKLFYMISAVALMASSASCNKIEQENTPATDGTTTLTVSATVPQTKTYFNDGKVKWVANDVITVFASDGTSVRSAGVSGSAVETYDFTVTGWDSEKTPLYALAAGPESYYTSYYDQVSYKDGVIRTKLRPSQALYQKNSYGKLANIAVGKLHAETESGMYSTIMRNLCGLIRFKVEGENTVKSVVIKDKNGKAMTGEVDIEMTQEGEILVPTVKEVIKGTSSVTITAVKTENLNNNTGMLPPGYIYACVLPGTYTPVIEVYGEGDTDSDDDDVLLNKLTAASEMTVTRNKYESIDVFVDTYKPSSDEDDPVVPTETKTITLDFSTAWPLSPDLDKNTKITDKTTYTLTQDDATYSFEVYSTTTGFYNTGNALRLSNASGTTGYITTPAMSGFKLTGVDVTITNSSGTKNIALYSECKGTTDAIATSGKIGDLISIDTSSTKNGFTTFSATAENTSYYLYTDSNNYQLGKLILTYTKVN